MLRKNTSTFILRYHSRIKAKYKGFEPRTTAGKTTASAHGAPAQSSELNSPKQRFRDMKVLALAYTDILTFFLIAE